MLWERDHHSLPSLLRQSEQRQRCGGHLGLLGDPYEEPAVGLVSAFTLFLSGLMTAEAITGSTAP